MTTFSIPSAPQNCDCAKGKSFDIHKTVVLGKPAASSLNLRTDAAHTPVFTLGKIFRITYLPLKSFNPFSDKSTAVNVKSFASEPTCGNDPTVCTGLPLNVMFAI